MLAYKDFRDIAEYGNKNWKGGYKPAEIETLALIYLEAYSSCDGSTVLNDLRELLEADYSNMSTNDVERENVSHWLCELNK